MFIEIDGYKLNYRIEGQGPTAIVVGSSRFYDRSFSKALRSHLRLVFIDWRGFAQSPAQEPEPSFDRLLDDIDLFRQTLGIDKCIIIGHSAHAVLALEYAKKYADHISHVVMIGMSPNLSTEHAEQAVHQWQRVASPERKAALDERIRRLPDDKLATLPPSEQFVAWYVRRDPQAWFDFNFDSSKLWEGVHPNMRLFDFLYGTYLSRYDVTQGLEKLDKPVFLALGGSDFIVAPPPAWDPFVPKFHDLTLRIFEKSGHSPQYEEQELFDAELLKWLGQ